MGKNHHLIIAFFVYGLAFNGAEALPAGRSIEGCGEAVVVLSDGTELSGSLIRVDPDTLWMEVKEVPASVGEGSSRRFWGEGEEGKGDDLGTPNEQAGEPATRKVRLPIREVQSLQCGDSDWDGLTAGLLAGVVVGGMRGVAGAIEGDWAAIPSVVSWTSPPCALLGAILDRSRGEESREYSQEHLKAIGEGSMNTDRVLSDQWLGEELRYGVLVGPYFQRFYPLRAHVKAMNMIGARLTWLRRKGLFQEFSFGLAERQGERWISLALDAGISWKSSPWIRPFIQLGIRHYERDYSESYRGWILDPDDRHILDIAFGGGVFINPDLRGLRIRPSFALHYPAGNWSGLEHWGRSEVEFGVYYGL